MKSLKRAAAALAFFAGVASAQNYPTKPVRIIVPYGPGGVDLQVRAMAPTLNRILGEQVVIENREGGAAAKRTTELLRARRPTISSERERGGTILRRTVQGIS